MLYPLASSHAQDLGGRENAVEVSTGLLLAYTIGAIVGPTTAASMMGQIGPQALFIHNGAIHLLFIVYIVFGHRVARSGAGSGIEGLGAAMAIAFGDQPRNGDVNQLWIVAADGQATQVVSTLFYPAFGAGF